MRALLVAMLALVAIGGTADAGRPLHALPNVSATSMSGAGLDDPSEERMRSSRSR